MIHIIVASVFLMATSSIVHGEDKEQPTLLNLGFKQQYLHGINKDLSPQEYKEISSRNRRFARKTLRSYSKHALGLTGIPEQGVNFMGAALGLVMNGASLDLNDSETFALEFKDVGNPDRSLYFGVNLDW